MVSVPFWARWKNSSGLGVLARRKGVLGVVLLALYDDGASHTTIQCSEILAFWPPPTGQAMLVGTVECGVAVGKR